MTKDDFSGIWRSKYRYKSGSRDGEFENEHLTRIHKRGNQLVAESVAKADKPYLIVHPSDGLVL